MKDVANICFPFQNCVQIFQGEGSTLAIVTKIDPKIQNLNQTVFIVSCLLMRTENGFSLKKTLWNETLQTIIKFNFYVFKTRKINCAP
jgi:hypothetical protein